jgi:hypothetical protein
MFKNMLCSVCCAVFVVLGGVSIVEGVSGMEAILNAPESGFNSCITSRFDTYYSKEVGYQTWKADAEFFGTSLFSEHIVASDAQKVERSKNVFKSFVSRTSLAHNYVHYWSPEYVLEAKNILAALKTPFITDHVLDKDQDNIEFFEKVIEAFTVPCTCER